MPSVLKKTTNQANPPVIPSHRGHLALPQVGKFHWPDDSHGCGFAGSEFGSRNLDALADTSDPSGHLI